MAGNAAIPDPAPVAESIGAAAEPAVDTAAAAQIFSSVTRSVSWTGASRVVSTVGNIVRYAVFARMLGPMQFGIAGAALFIVDLLTAASGATFQKALINQEDETQPYLDTVWSITTVRGIVIAIALVLASHPLANYFRQGPFYLAFWAVAPLAILRGIQNPALATLFRRMDFKVMLILNSAEIIASFGVGVIAILHWRDWRGLVVSAIAGQLVRTVMMYWYFPYRPHLSIDRELARRVIRYARWVTGANVAQFCARQLDNIVVAHLLGPRSLGEYQMAYSIGEMPMGEFASSLSLVCFSVVSRLSGKHPMRQRLFRLSNLILLAVGAGYAALLVLWGAPIIRVGLGARWLGALAPLKMLCLYGLFQGVMILGRGFIDGMGVPNWSFRVLLTRAVALAIVIYPLTARWGTSGAGGAALISVIVPLPFMFMLYHRAGSSK